MRYMVTPSPRSRWLRLDFIETDLVVGAVVEFHGARQFVCGDLLGVLQGAAVHADATTTKLYDRRGYNPKTSASFFASY